MFKNFTYLAVLSHAGQACSGVVMGQNLLVSPAIGGKAPCAKLAHATAVAVSICSSGEISHSVMAIFDDLKRAKHTLRISLSHVTTTDEINKFLNIFNDVYENLKTVR